MRAVNWTRHADTMTRRGMTAWWFASHAERGCGDPRGGRCACTCPDHGCGTDRPLVAGEPVRCGRCRDSGFTRRRGLQVGDPDFGKAIPCPDCNTEAGEEALADRVRRARIPDALWECGQWDRIDQRYGPEPKRGARAWAQGGSQQKPFLVLMGNTGTGKTAAAVAAARDLLAAGVSVRYVETVALLGELRACYGEDAERSVDAVLLPYLRVGCLLLDDLGAEKPTEWTEERLTDLINQRLVNRALTIITTNLTPLTAPQTRLWSRVFGDRHAFIVPTAGPDRRREVLPPR
jgi:DNA replication protein DnaC